MTQPIDPDFAARVAAYQAQRDKGLVFQADGTLGGIVLRPRRSPHRNWIGRVLGLALMVSLVFAVKVSVLQVMGTSAYNSNLVRLTSSTSVIDQAVGKMLHLDPITLALDAQFVKIEMAVARHIRALH